VKIQTSRFGEIRVDEKSVLSMPGGLIGFPKQESYVLIRHSQDSPFYWLQSVDDPDLAFVIVDPLIFRPDYKVPFTSGLLGLMKAESPDELGIFVIVTIPQGRPEKMTANLLGPVVINTEKRLARQLVLDEKNYSHRHPIMATKPEDPATGGKLRYRT
jgi:flagellar assembly factor FliW